MTTELPPEDQTYDGVSTDVVAADKTLSMIDDMDAKMMMLEKAYENVKDGEYTERLFALDNRAFYKSRD